MKNNNFYSNNTRNNTARTDEKGHTPLWMGTRPFVRPDFINNMRDHAPFIVTQDSVRNDLGLCVIMTKWPYIVAKIHRFHTQCNDKRGQKTIEDARKRIESSRREWLSQRAIAWHNAELAAEEGTTFKELKEKALNEHEASKYANEFDASQYDREFDEPRLIAKVLGLNAYLELYGTMDDLTLIPDWSEQTRDYLYVSYRNLRYCLQWAADFYRGFLIADECRQLATMPGDYQPIKEWEDDIYKEQEPRKFIPRECGLGHDDTDPVRRPLRYPRHKFDAQEREELKHLKRMDGNASHPATNAERQQQAAATVANRRLLNGQDIH